MLSIIIVGINGWEEYTRPLIADIWTQEPDADIIVVDNASEKPYPTAPHIRRSDQRLSYAEAINLGIESAGERDWYVVIKNNIRVNNSNLLKSILENIKERHGA